MSTLVRYAERGGETAQVTLRCVGQHPWRLEADGPTGLISAEADDLFSAVLRLREQLEREGWLLQVNGARVDAWPSQMALQAGGRQLYVLPADRPPELTDLVEALAPIAEGRAGTIDEQRQYFERWSDARGTR